MIEQMAGASVKAKGLYLTRVVYPESIFINIIMSEKKKEHKKVVGKVYDVKLFTRLMRYARDYKLQFDISVIAVLSVALLAAIRPVLLRKIIDDYIFDKDAEQLVVFTQFDALGTRIGSNFSIPIHIFCQLAWAEYRQGHAHPVV